VQACPVDVLDFVVSSCRDLVETPLGARAVRRGWLVDPHDQQLPASVSVDQALMVTVQRFPDRGRLTSEFFRDLVLAQSDTGGVLTVMICWAKVEVEAFAHAAGHTRRCRRVVGWLNHRHVVHPVSSAARRR